ncbi:hypothetical protein MASR2M79_04920 [Aminivibrio sp.]
MKISFRCVPGLIDEEPYVFHLSAILSDDHSSAGGNELVAVEAEAAEISKGSGGLSSPRASEAF